jgi:hypothetical protein
MEVDFVPATFPPPGGLTICTQLILGMFCFLWGVGGWGIGSTHTFGVSIPHPPTIERHSCGGWWCVLVVVVCSAGVVGAVVVWWCSGI